MELDSLNVNLSSLSCPSTSFCVGYGAWLGTAFIATSHNPTGGAGAWTISTLSYDSLFAASVSCASESLCVAINGDGSALTSTDPTAGIAAWKIIPAIDANGAPSAVSCPSASLCVVVDEPSSVFPPNGGNIVHTIDPTAGTDAYMTTFVDAPPSCIAAPCTGEEIYARDDDGTRLIDMAPLGAGRSLANLALSAGSLTLGWTHDGVARQVELR